MPISDAKRKANKKWNDANMSVLYDRISVLVPKGRKEDIAVFAKEHRLSTNALINVALCRIMGIEEPEWKSPGQIAAEDVPDVKQEEAAEDVQPVEATAGHVDRGQGEAVATLETPSAVEAASVEPVAEVPAAVDAEEQ